eukprot:gene68991-94546_t
MFPLTAHLQAPLIAADLRLPHAAWSLDMRVGPVRRRSMSVVTLEKPAATDRPVT